MLSFKYFVCKLMEIVYLVVVRIKYNKILIGWGFIISNVCLVGSIIIMWN